MPGQQRAQMTNRVMNHGSKNSNTIDPFGRVNQKARKVIESVERQRQTPADPRAGSTGGSFDEDIEYANKFHHIKIKPMG